MSEILAQLTLDQTYFYELALFFIVFVFLTLFFFNPFLKHLETRYARTTEDKETANKLMGEFSERMKHYEASMKEAHRQSQEVIQKALQEAKARENAILFEAREEARKKVQETHQALSQEKSLIRAQVKSELEQLVTSVTNKLLAK